ncbi:unnamed protein product [Musa hybrid cultivar]
MAGKESKRKREQKPMTMDVISNGSGTEIIANHCSAKISLPNCCHFFL